jgi:hypothetical protein
MTWHCRSDTAEAQVDNHPEGRFIGLFQFQPPAKKAAAPYGRTKVRRSHRGQQMKSDAPGAQQTINRTARGRTKACFFSPQR